jgi:hypothetical protein
MADTPPHFAFPFRRRTTGSKAVETVDQDSLGHVDACAQVVIRCPQGFRDDMPDFGWPFPTFKTAPLDTRPVRDALVKWGHPLGSPTVTEHADAIDAAVRFIDIIEQVEGA